MAGEMDEGRVKGESMDTNSFETWLHHCFLYLC